MIIREANESELKEVIAYFTDFCGDNDFEGYRIAVFQDYVSDCPGWCGDVYAVIGGYVSAYVMLKRNESGRLEAFASEILNTGNIEAEEST